MKKLKKAVLLTALCAAALALSGCGKASADGKTHLTFQIWDVAQRDGMQAMCDAYTEQNPDVVIEVQVTSWKRRPSPTRCRTSSGCTPMRFSSTRITERLRI